MQSGIQASIQAPVTHTQSGIQAADQVPVALVTHTQSGIQAAIQAPVTHTQSGIQDPVTHMQSGIQASIQSKSVIKKKPEKLIGIKKVIQKRTCKSIYKK
jgi:hypothetical protein